MTKRWRHAVAAVGVSVLLAGVTACGADPSGPRPGRPDSTMAYDTVENGHLSVEYPATWTKMSQLSPPWKVGFEGDGMQMQVAGQFSDDVGSFSALARLDLPASLKLPGYKPVETEDISVPGAYNALYRKYTYTDAGTSRQGIWILASQWPYPAVAAVSVSGVKLDDDVVNQIMKSMSFKKYH